MEFTGERFVPLDSLFDDEIAFEHLHRYHTVSEIVKDKIVLDIASGEGYGTALLAKYAEKVFGVDIDTATVEHAQKKYAGIGNIEFIIGSADNIPLPDHSIDVVISYETIEHLDEPTQEKFLHEIKRVLKKGGKLVISTPDKINYSDRYAHTNEFHLKEFTSEEFFDFLKSYFGHIIPYLQGYEIVGAITESEPKKVVSLRVTDWKRSTRPFSRKYLISICSDKPFPKNPDFSSVVFQVNKDFMQMTDRIVEMEAHILELGAWGRRLDKEIIEKDKTIETQQKMLIDQSNSLSQLTVLKDNLKEERKRLLQNESYIQSELQKKLDTIISTLAENKYKEEVISRLETDLLNKKIILEETEKSLILESELRKQSDQELLNKEGIIINQEKEIEVKDSLLKKQSDKIFELEIDLQNQSKVIFELRENNKIMQAENRKLITDRNGFKNEIEKLTKQLNDSKGITDEQNRKIHLLYHELDAMNDRLSEIYGSEGWKLLKMYFTIKGKLLPETSNRYKILKKAVNKIRGKKDPYALPSKSSKPAIQSSKKILSQPEADIISETKKDYDVIEFPFYDYPLASIVMPAYNGWQLTYNCLKSIKENTLGISYEIIIGDDASTDETKEIKRYIRNIVVVRNEKNLEFLHNCNNAATYAKGKYILFLNNDTEVRPNWLSSMADLMEKDEKIGMVGSKLIYPDGRLQEAGAIVWRDASGWNFGHNQDPDAPEFNYVKEVDYISGASIIIRTHLWKEIGGFDKRYTPAYCEDSDLAFEVRKHGYKVVYQPLSEVIHYEGYTHGTDNNEGIKGNEIKAYQKLNNQKFKEKWKSILEKEHFPNGEKVFWARDKSSKKKTILVVDHYVPHFDRDAGSRSTYQLLQLLVEMNYNVKFIGDNFFRHEPYTTILQQMGVEVLYGPWCMNNWKKWVTDNKEMLDYVYLNRPHISVKYIDFIKENTNAKIIYFGHDLHYVRELSQYEIEKDPLLLVSSREWKITEMKLSQKADIVLTLSEKEKDLAEKELDAKKVILMPIFYYQHIKPPVLDFRHRRDILFIGGFKHKPNVDAVLWFCREIWPLITAQNNDINFIVAGSDPPQDILGLGSKNIIVKGYVTDEELEILYASVKLVVIPLRYGAGVKGKIIEAMYQGVPVITTHFGIEGLSNIKDVLQSFDSAEAFSEQVINYYQSNTKLVSMSYSGVEYIKKYYSKEKMKEVVQCVFV